MGWIQVLGAVLTLVLEFWKYWREREDEKRKERKELLDEAKKAIDSRDGSRVNLLFGRLRNL